MIKATALTRREFLGRAPVACGMLPLSAYGSVARPAANSQPNVIIVLTDDQGYGDLSCHGNPVLRTPSIDRLYEESIRLTDFHVTPVCSPTRSALLTGLDCLGNGGHRAGGGMTFIRQGVPTIAEIFAANGYATGQFGKWHLGDNYPHRPQDRGFQETVHCNGFGVGALSDCWNNDYFDDKFWHNNTLTSYKGYCTDVWFSEARRWIQQCRQPFFAYIAPNAPHGPLYVPDRYREPYRNLPLPAASFFGMIANIDENVGALDSFLVKQGLRDNTILIFMTDNGSKDGIRVFDAGMRGTKTSVYEGGHRVPCFIRWPSGKLRHSGDIAAPTQCQDIAPTLIDFCGLKVSPGQSFDGASLGGILRGKPQPELDQRMLVVQYGRHSPDQTTVPPVTKWDAAVLWKRWRLVNGTELYDTSYDTPQRVDLGLAYGRERDKMREHYEQWWNRMQASLREPVPIIVGSPHANPTRLSAEDWFGLFSYASLVRVGVRRNGHWNILVDQAGDYEFSLRRWPEEADTAICAGLPALPLHDKAWGSMPAGKALPIARARLKVGMQEESKPVGAADKAVNFRLALPAGAATLQTWFSDSSDQELCGAWYTGVRRIVNSG